MERGLSANESTRMRVLRRLKRWGSATVAELARDLNLSGVSLRRHLDILERDHLVTAQVQPRGRGRPVKVYRLTEEADRFFPERYSEFAVDLLQGVREAFGEGALRRLLQHRTSKLIERIKARLTGKSLRERVELLTEAMTEMGFLASWQRAGVGRFILTQAHCPLRRIAMVCPELCEQELRMHQAVLEACVTRECFIPQGEAVCRYQIRYLPARVKAASLRR
jgi:predicted ArsR family transcriptional regulator